MNWKKITSVHFDWSTRYTNCKIKLDPLYEKHQTQTEYISLSVLNCRSPGVSFLWLYTESRIYWWFCSHIGVSCVSHTHADRMKFLSHTPVTCVSHLRTQTHWSFALTLQFKLCLAARGSDSGAAAVVAQKAQQFNYLCQHNELRLCAARRCEICRGAEAEWGPWDKWGGGQWDRNWEMNRGRQDRTGRRVLEAGSLGNKQKRGRGNRMDLLFDEAIHRQSYGSEWQGGSTVYDSLYTTQNRSLPWPNSRVDLASHMSRSCTLPTRIERIIFQPLHNY